MQKRDSLFASNDALEYTKGWSYVVKPAWVYGLNSPGKLLNAVNGESNAIPLAMHLLGNCITLNNCSSFTFSRSPYLKMVKSD